MSAVEQTQKLGCVVKFYIVLLVLFVFVATLPRRSLPWAYPIETSFSARPKLLEKWFYDLPPVKRTVDGIINRESEDAGEAPAFGITTVLYVVAFYSIASDGLFSFRVCRFLEEVRPLIYSSFVLLGAAAVLYRKKY